MQLNNGKKEPYPDGYLEEMKAAHDQWVLDNPDWDTNRALASRRFRYEKESDPLRAEWQYEVELGTKAQTELDAMKQAWLDKVAEIKSDIPLP